MTKKHMEFVAALILASRNGVSTEALANMAAAKFAKENPHFDETRFFEACWYGPDCPARVAVGGADKMTS